MPLSPEEQRLLAELQTKANEVEQEPAFKDIGDVLRYLVSTSDKFSANPDDRQVALDVIEAAFPKVVEAVA